MSDLRVVVVADRGDDDAGFLGERFDELGGVRRPCLRDDATSLAGAEQEADVLVLLGSDRSVHDPAHAGVVAAEQALVHRARARGVPILGVCYGGQLAAAALGATVARAPVGEYGWFEVETTVPWLSGPWFQFHGDRWSGGDGVPSIATSPRAPQAFRQGRTLGVQFHPEVTPNTARRWLAAAEPAVIAAGGDPSTIEAELDLLAPDARIRCHRLVDAFLEEVAAADPHHGVAAPGASRRR